jgi:hypothetical protein
VGNSQIWKQRAGIATLTQPNINAAHKICETKNMLLLLLYPGKPNWAAE